MSRFKQSHQQHRCRMHLLTLAGLFSLGTGRSLPTPLLLPSAHMQWRALGLVAASLRKHWI